MKVALVHDFLREYGGAERVLAVLHELWPEAPIYTAFVDWKGLGPHADELKKWDIRESWVSRNPLVKKFHSPLRFLAPKIWESFDVSGYDVVVSSSGWYISRGIITTKPTVHICYLHHPPRHLYGYQTAVNWQKHLPVRIYAHIVNHFLRMYDFQTAQKVDYFIANSKETQKRITKFYRRESTVIYPPVEVPKLLGNENSLVHKLASPQKAATARSQTRSLAQTTTHSTISIASQLPLGNYYLSVSRLARAKHIDLMIEACNTMKSPLVIVGQGRERAYLQSIAGPTVTFLGEVKDEELPTIYAGAKAFIIASEDEEFGIAAVEAMGYGKPVIAYRSGGLIETVIDGKTGVFFDKLTAESLEKAMKRLTRLTIQPSDCIAQAEKFSKEKFIKKMKAFVEEKVKKSEHSR